MRAKQINFERGVEPKKALNLGVKHKLYELLPKTLTGGGAMYQIEWIRLKEFLEDPQTEISFDETDFNENVIVITIKRPKSQLNWFVWEYIVGLLGKFHPRDLYPQTKDDEKLILSTPK